MKIFFDNHLPRLLAQALNILSSDEGVQVEHLRDKFDASISDVDWITALGEEGGWVIVSADTSIFRKKIEFEAWREANLTTFSLKAGWQNIRRWEIIWKIARIWSELIRHAKKNHPGSLFSIGVRNLHFERVNLQ